MVDMRKLVVARGFTLIELLVVIGIIAMLLSLLVPGLRRARDQAHGVQCQSNMRRMFDGFVMYAQAFDDRIPPYGNAQTPGRGWFRYLGRQGYWGEPKQNGPFSIDRWDLFRCPAESGSSWAEQTTGQNVTYYDSKYMGSSYVMNFYVSWYESDTHYPPYRPFRRGLMAGPEKVSAIYPPSYLAKDRADAPFVMDIQDIGEGWGMYYFYEPDRIDHWYYVQGYTGYNYAFRHVNKTANVLYMDGHVEARKHVMHGGAPIQRLVWTYPPSQVP